MIIKLKYYDSYLCIFTKFYTFKTLFKQKNMKNITFVLSLLLALLANSEVSLAQKFKILEGNANALKMVSRMNIEYDYSNMGVGKFENEQDYLDKKMKAYNEKEPGRGDKWLQSWQGDRSKKFEPQFKELFNKYAKRARVGTYQDAKYTMIASTVFTEPGFNIYVQRRNARIDMVFTILDENKNVVAKIEMKGAAGRSFGGNDYDTGIRIEEAYAKAGKSLAKKYFSK
jgi:hypothetical protein